MQGFGLLIGHLLGDYIFQNDWMALNKTAAWPTDPVPDGLEVYGRFPFYRCRITQGNSTTAEYIKYLQQVQKYRLGAIACTVHCFIYTYMVWLCSCTWMPWWGVLLCFLIHWPIDRYRLARWWMVNVSGQEQFASGLLSPWSVIVVDNTIHLLTLYFIALLAT